MKYVTAQRSDPGAWGDLAMATTTPVSGKAAACLAGLLSVACGLLALASRSDLFLVGVVLFSVLALVLGAWRWLEIKRASGGLRGQAFVAWGIGIPAGGLALGFLLLPA